MATRRSTHLATTTGNNIRRARLAAGLTQHAVATALRTSVSRVSGWEQGHHLPRNQAAIAELLFDGDVAAMFREEQIAA